MKILYRQTPHSTGSLKALGISDCYYKQLLVDADRNSITKTHHHTGFELHIITCGSQEYQAEDNHYTLHEGQFLLIPPKIPHRVVQSEKDTRKTAITFNISPTPYTSVLHMEIPENIMNGLSYITAEAATNRLHSSLLVENRILEMILTVLRNAGMEEGSTDIVAGDNDIITLSQQYITDNIENNPTVSEVAKYCHLSPKQLTRIFNTHSNLSPGEYIIHQRAKYIENLLIQNSLTLKQISETMHFSNEYYFNVFFKKYIGMPPGEYRKMHGK